VYIKETYWKWGKWVKNGLTRSGKQAWKFTPVPTFVPTLAKSVSFEQHEKIPRTETGWHKRLARFMPACDARSLARTVSVRPERVQEITEEDAIREGIGYGFQMNAGWPDYQHIVNGVCTLTQDDAVSSFISLWDTLYPGSWERNDWEWRIELEKRRVR